MSMDSAILFGAIKDRMTDELGYDFSKSLDGAKTLEIIVDEVIKHIQEKAVIKTILDSSLNTIFKSGVPVLNDGGATLQQAWIAFTGTQVTDKSTGTIT